MVETRSRRSQNESERPWRLPGALACGFLPNGLASTSRRCNGSVALSRPSSPVSKEALSQPGGCGPLGGPPYFSFRRRAAREAAEYNVHAIEEDYPMKYVFAAVAILLVSPAFAQ